MTHFRRKLAVILVDSGLNDDNIRNRGFEDDKSKGNKGYPADCMIVDKPSKKLKTVNISSEVEYISQPWILSPSSNPTDDELIDELCLCISMADDVPSLE